MSPLNGIRSATLLIAPMALVLTATAALAKQNPPAETSLPPPVAAWLAQAKQDCPQGFENRNAVESADLTGHGRPGFIADPHKLVCAGEPHLYQGDGPASIELFVTLPTGEVVHTGGVRALAYQLMPGAPGAPPTLSFQTHEDGERAGSIDNYRWDGRNFTLLNKSAMAYPPVSGPDSEYQK